MLLLVGCASNRSPAAVASRVSDVRIVEVGHTFEDFQYRAPYQFGGRSVDRVTILNVTCRLRGGDGRESWGFGSMTLGNAWAFPAASQDVGLGAMKALADALNPITADCDESGHPIDLFRVLEPQYLKAAAASFRRRRRWRSRFPKLATLVVASPFDAAIHDAYGKRLGAELLPDLRTAVHEPRPVARSRRAFKGETSTATSHEHRGRHAAVPFGRRHRSAGGGRRRNANRRRLARNPRGMDSARRPDALQDQAQRRRPGGDVERVVRIDRVVKASRPRAASRTGSIARFQRGMPERRLSARLPAARARSARRRASSASSTSSSRPHAI